jgi:hypothetical protein
VAWRRSGPTAACAGDALPRDSGGRWGRHDADSVADRWAGSHGGGGWSLAAGCGARQRGEAVGAALTGGAGSTVRPIRFSNRIKPK